MAIEACQLQPLLDELEQLPLVDWPRAAEARQQLLQALYKDFSRGAHPCKGLRQLP